MWLDAAAISKVATKCIKEKSPNLTKCELICHLSLQKRVSSRKKGAFKNVVKKCNEKEIMSIMLSRRIQLHFHFMYFIPIEFSNAKKIP